MSVIIPLEFQRKCEKRWAARFRQPVSTAPQHQSGGTNSVSSFKCAKLVNKGKAGYVIDLTTGGVDLAEGENRSALLPPHTIGIIPASTEAGDASRRGGNGEQQIEVACRGADTPQDALAASASHSSARG
jgi:hypothetical protein